MKRRVLYAFVVLSAVIELAGCKSLLKKRDPDPAPSANPVVVTPPAVIAPAVSVTPPVEAPPVQAAVDETAVPTSQDFEDEAFAKVTPANFRAEFAQLKKDVATP